MRRAPHHRRAPHRLVCGTDHHPRYRASRARLLAVHPTHPRLLHSQPGAVAVALASVDPAVAIGMLVASALSFEGRFDGHYLILALLVFSLTFPGGPGRERPAAARQF